MFQPAIRLKYVFTLFLLVFTACMPLMEGAQSDVQETPTTSQSITPLVTETPATINTPVIPEVVAPPSVTQQIRNLSVMTNTFTTDAFEGIHYSFSDAGRLVGILSNDELLFHKPDSLWAVTLNGLMARSVVGPILLPIATTSNSRIIIATNDFSKQYPIWSVDAEGKDFVLMGRTTGYFPFFSVASDGKVLLVESGHLVLKQIYQGTVQSQLLEALETELGISWENLDLTLPPDYDQTPWIDFEISPDGKWVAVFDSHQAKLWLATIDGQLVQDISIDPTILASRSTEGEGPQVVFLGWSPDSQRVVYREAIWTQRPRFNYSQLKVVDIANNPPFNLTYAGIQFGETAAWSPDNQHIAFAFQSVNSSPSSDQLVQGQLFVANMDGTEPQLVSNTYISDHFGLFWQFNGSTLVYKCQLTPNRIDVCVSTITE